MPVLLPMDIADELFERFNDPDENQETYARLNDMQADDLTTMIDFPLASDQMALRIVRNPQPGIELEIFLLDHKNQAVLYFNRVEEVDLSIDNRSGRPVRQIMIWRDTITNGGEDTHGLVEKVFFEFLVDQYCIVVSDSEQTREGRRMWQKLLGMALEKGIEAGRIDEEKHDYQQIHNRKELHEASKWLWGTRKIHEKRLAVIMKL